ncbi:MAG: DUF1684 domain-containing protein [Ignavibacteriaceae bacterium]|nr:DUF1684 domain-containing protein [Ignavibacteriaceae bacterium]
MKNLIFGLLIVPFLLLINGCQKLPEEKAAPEYKKEITEWQKKRVDNLKKETGWLNLAGLFWLHPGANSFGSGKNNSVIFPDAAPENLGIFYLTDGAVSVKFSAAVKVNDEILDSTILKDDLSGNADVMSIGRYKWFVIKRGDKFGIRLRDLDAELLKNFPGIESFPINEDWKLTEKFVPYLPPKIIAVPNVLGTIEPEISPGYIKFTKDNKQFALDAIDSGDKLFLIFADETSGEETYGAGRFLYTDKPDSTGKIILDFNKAYNPPCAFSKYATCPLPPRQNNLHLKVTAGEKKFGLAH